MLATALAMGLSAIVTLTPPDQGEVERGAPAKTRLGEPGHQVLAGPKVKTADRPATLVERDFAGKLKRLDVDPAQAALGMLELSDEERGAADRVLSERAAEMDKLVTDNLREVVQIAQAFASRDAAEGLRLLNDLFAKAPGLRERGRLEDGLAGALDAMNAAELRRLTREYREAAIAESAQEPGRGGRPRGRLGAIAYERIALLGQEVRLSFERTVAAQGRDFDALLKRLNVTPEQESKIQAVVQETYVATYGKPTRAQQTAGFVKIYGVLDAEQRGDLVRYVREQSGAKAAEQQSSK